MPHPEDAGRFAREAVLTTLDERYRGGSFSRELWRAMGEEGLLGMTIPTSYGGAGGTPGELARALREFAGEGCDLGLTLCWITHLTLCAVSILKLGTEEQKSRYLPRLASGEWLCAAAVSEPGTGAHPGKMCTRAEADAGGFLLEGTKAFTTGGPEADLLLVMAVTGEAAEGAREISAFLVEGEAAGLTTENMDLEFLRTAPHSITNLAGVRVPAEAMLGAPGEGHSRASRDAFARERAAVFAAVSGILGRAANEVADRYRQRNEGFELDGLEGASWIHHLAALAAYEKLSDGLVADSFEGGASWSASLDVLIYMGISYLKWCVWIEDFVTSHRLERGFPLEPILPDLKLMQVNERLLIKEGRKRFVR